MTGGEDHVGRTVAVGQGAGNGCRGGKRSRDARHHLELNAIGVERGNLFSGTAEDERVATLKADDDTLGASVLDHEVVDVFLRDAFCSAALADIDDFSVGTGELEDRGGNQVVVKNNVGRLNEPLRFDRKQVGVPGPGTDKVDLAGLAG